MAMDGTRVSVVVVSYNTRDALRRCLSQIEPEHEIVVVDNASNDGSPGMVAAEFPDAKLIANKTNVGFGSANNQGMDTATGKLVLFLNSDCYAHPGALSTLAQVFEASSVAAAGGRLLNPDGSLQQSSANDLTLWAVFCEQTFLERLFPNSRFFSPYWNSQRFGVTSETTQIMGACLMTRRLERFDERFFLYCEDTDLCRRLRNHGRILHVPGALFTHDLGSSTTNRWEAIARYNRGKELYFSIHHGQISATICWVMNRIGALKRLAVWSLATIATRGRNERFHARVGMFWRVFTAPRDGPLDPRML